MKTEMFIFNNLSYMKTKNFILVFLMAVSSNVIMAQTDGQRQFYKDAEKVQETAKTYKYGNTDQAWKDGVAAKDLKIKLDEHGNAYWKVEKSESNSSSNSNTTPRSSGRTSTPSYTPPPSNNGYNNTVNSVWQKTPIFSKIHFKIHFEGSYFLNQL